MRLDGVSLSTATIPIVNDVRGEIHFDDLWTLTTPPGQRVTVGELDVPAAAGSTRRELDVAFEIVGPMVPQVSAGAVRALAVSSDRRNPALPDVPTVREAGLAGYNVASWNALAAPAGTPPEVIDKLGRAAREAVASPEVRERLGKLGMRLAASTPAEMQALLTGEIQRWGEVIRRAKIEPE